MVIDNVKGIVWDLDGTLLNSFTVYTRIITEIAQEKGLAMPTTEQILGSYHASLDETVSKVLGIKSKADLDSTINNFLKKQQTYYEGDLETHLFQDAVALAQQAAKLGIPQLLVTNRGHAGRGSASPRYIIAATTLTDYIHEVNPGDEVVARKPDKRAMGDWIRRHKLAPEEILVIGDQFVDAQLAINIGARAVLVKRNGDIPHLDELSHTDSLIMVDNLESIRFE